MDVREAVFESLDNAIQNGYELWGTAEEIAEDLVEKTNVGSDNPEYVAQFVVEWKKARGHTLEAYEER